MKKLLLFFVLFLSFATYGANIGDRFEKVTSISDLTIGDEYILCYDNVAAGKKSRNIRTAVQGAITVEGNNATIANADVEVFSILEGTVSNSYVFKFSDGYWECTSISNGNTPTNATLTDNANMSISIDNGVATIIPIANSNKNQNKIQYNKTSGSERFTNYKIGTQQNCTLYKKDNRLQPEMSFRDQIVQGKLGVGVVWEPVTVTVPADPSQRGNITYTSSDPSIVSINAETGQITPDDVHAKGEVTITATMAATDLYVAGTASYKVIILDPTAQIEPGTITFDFTTENPYGMETGTYVDGKVINLDVVTLTFKGQCRSWEASNNYELRVNAKTDAYPNNGFTISVPEGYKISKIGFVATGGTGTFEPQGADDQNGEGTFDVTWDPAGKQDVITSVTFTNNETQAKFSQIYVMYDAATSILKSANLSFKKVVYSIYENEESVINAVNNPFNRTITYQIENLAEDQYTIVPDGTNLKVKINQPGYYSLQATSPEGDGYRDGFAILRVNVYRHLKVYSNGVSVSSVIGTNEKDVNVTIDVPELVNLYYQVAETADDTPAATTETVDGDENQLVGYELYDESEGIIIDKGFSGVLRFYIANYGYLSPIRSIPINSDIMTGVEEIEASEDDNVAPVYFNLNGMRVNAENLVPGVYVRRSGAKAEKVLVK